MLYYYLAAALVILLDQASKWWIVRDFELNESRSIIGDFFMLTSHRNRGAAFGILQDQRMFFIVITIIIVAGLTVFLGRTAQKGERLLSWALALILGGAIGNFIDRLLTGEVVDFLHFRFQFSWFGTEIDYSYPIFNLADSAIVIGVILVFLDTFRTWMRERRRAEVHES